MGNRHNQRSKRNYGLAALDIILPRWSEVEDECGKMIYKVINMIH